MIVYPIERAWCDECQGVVPVYPFSYEQYERGEYILAYACCYKHSDMAPERALFRSGNPADYPMATPPPRFPPPRQQVEEEWDEEKVTFEIELSHYQYFLSLPNEIDSSDEIPPQGALASREEGL